MIREEIDQLGAWSAAEGWNPGRYDADCYWKLDPDGFLAVEVDGELGGGGAIVRHNPRFGFMGLFIVQPKFRGRDLGRELWYARRDRLLARLQPGATIGMDGVDAMVPFYERGGFHSFTRDRRYQLSDPHGFAAPSTDLVDLRGVERAALLSFDGRVFPGDRWRFLELWMHQPEAVALASVNAGRLEGYGILRRCLVGWKLGPFAAERVEIADRLLRAFCLAAGNEPLFVDMPGNNPAALELARSFGMREVFGCQRMYLGPAPALEHPCVYGIGSMEVG